MSNKIKLWHGFLEAGEKSSPVLEDPKLNSEGDNYRYLYNLKSDRIIKYKSEIVNAKLRELNDEEKDVIPRLEKLYNKARKTFLGKATAGETTPEPATAAATGSAAGKTVLDISMEPMDSMEDMDWDEDSLEADTVEP